eukprot:1005620-Prymnesium_polylepis.1
MCALQRQRDLHRASNHNRIKSDFNSQSAATVAPHAAPPTHPHATDSIQPSKTAISIQLYYV